jgi:biopolymer transport protein ExbD
MRQAISCAVAFAVALTISACNSMRASPPDVITLEVLADGTFLWNGERVADVETLDRYWKTVAVQDPQPEIHLKGNPDARYDALARALEAAQRNGVTKLGFVANVTPQATQQ